MKMRDLITLIEGAHQPELSEDDLAWIDDAVLTDFDNNPLVVYHGTGAAFDAFEHGQSNGFSKPRKGFYFTDDESIAQEFGRVSAYLLKMRKTANFVNGAGVDVISSIVEHNPDLGAGLRRAVNARYGDEEVSSGRLTSLGELQTDEFVSALRQLGYDSMIFEDALGMSAYFDSYVVFEPGQIRRIG